MNRNIVISFGFHITLVIITAMSLPFLSKKPINLPLIVSVELIQITDKTNIPFAPKAKKIIIAVKEKTGCPIIFNTSFNLGGEPLVETLDDAIRTLDNCDIEYLYLPEYSKLITVKN